MSVRLLLATPMDVDNVEKTADVALDGDGGTAA
jgi:hypothetical protein